MPELYIITGSNGAGKSTVGPKYLPQQIQEQCTVFDGDKLYMQKQKELWQTGIKAHKEAKKIALAFVEETFDNLVHEALTTKQNFVYEGHFTNDATWDIPQRFKEDGYTINLLFLGLTDPNLSELRVIDRTHIGGHYVSRPVIEDNFYGNLEKLDKYFPILNTLKIIDSSGTGHTLLAHLSDQKIISCVPIEHLPMWFTTNLKRITEIIRLDKCKE